MIHGARADAADAHDLARGVDIAVALEHPVAVSRQRAAVVAHDRVHRGVETIGVIHTGQLFDRDDQRRVVDDPRPSVDLLGELAEVRQVRVTAQLYLETSPRPIGEIALTRLRRPYLRQQPCI
jgi:hypothetical protein